MSNKSINRLGSYLNIIWTIASKDIIDALKNRVVISMVIMLSIILIAPKILPLIFEQPQPVLPIYDTGNSSKLTDLLSDADISIQKLRSDQEWGSVLCGGVYPEIGLLIPVDFDQLLATSTQIEIQGFVCWSSRHQVSEVRTKIDHMLSQALGQPVIIHTEGNIVYPVSDGVLSLSLATINSVLMILMMGIFLVPSLFFEEKESKTLQALLVSPASIAQVVIGKALAGSFYILVTAVMIFTISWVEVIHWDMAILFVIGGGFFSVAVGLIMGSFFEKQQDVVGWMAAFVLLIIGSVLVDMLGIDLPALVENILPWVPSVAMAKICRASFSESVTLLQVWQNMGIILVISLPLYALVIWKVRRSDR
jgi:ABC-2 type transport system permease protein